MPFQSKTTQEVKDSIKMYFSKNSRGSNLLITVHNQSF